jgi:hypothetical protein
MILQKKYKTDTSKEHLREDVDVQEAKFKYRIHAECVRILNKSVGHKQEAQALTFKPNVFCCTVLWTTYMDMVNRMRYASFLHCLYAVLG